jgi:adenylate cyclase
LDIQRFNELLLESVGVGLALVAAKDLDVLFCNPKFAEWFEGADARGARLDALVPGLDVSALRERLAAGRDQAVEVEVKRGRRTLSILLRIAAHERDGLALLLVEGQNISKLKELEYMVESYSSMVEKQNRTLRREKERAEKLLLNIMPRTVYEEIKSFGVTTPQRFDAASVLMLDFVGFTEMTVARDPTALIGELNDIFTNFDRIAEQFGCERIKTIGDAYMAVCGVPEPNSEHAAAIAKVALLFVRYLERRNASHEQTWRCRIGLATGPVIGSIVGIQKYVYDIFGPGVNLAARLEALAGPMEILVAEPTYRAIRDSFRISERGEAELRGFGAQRIYLLEASREPLTAPAW